MKAINWHKAKHTYLARWLWEREYVDMWSIVHLTTGMCFGFCIFFYDSPFKESFVVFIVLTIVWEIIEYYDQAKETLGNQIMDVVSGALGFWATKSFIPVLAPNLKGQLIYFTVIYIIAWSLAYLGFISFALHLNRDVEKYKKSFSAAVLIYILVMSILYFI